MPKIELKEVCQYCKGTGLYIGMAERDGAAVVCHKCNGTDCFNFVHEYKEFKERFECKNVKWVYQANPGIVVGNTKCKFSDFGGMSYNDWKNDRKFESGMEMRRYTCPAWWYQSVDWDKKPDWGECYECLGNTFSQCKYFKDKEKCWERFDKENK